MSSDRDELARDLSNFLGQAMARAYDDPAIVTIEEPVADALIAAGWRKKPDEAAIRAIIVAVHEGFYSDAYRATADILALMDGPTETGEK